MSAGPARGQRQSHVEIAIDVLFADEDLVVVDKPAGMPSVPARTPLDPPCVAVVLARQFGFLEPVHRLDRDTSGILVLARSPAARASLGRAFETRQVRKRYEAIVQGRPLTSEGEVRLPLARDPDRPPRYRVDPILGREAITRWRLLEISEQPDDGPWSWLELEPVTGRSHQLRVHLAWLGLPIVGDRLYGRRPVVDSDELALRAVSTSLRHPRDGRPLEFMAASLARRPETGQPRRPASDAAVEPAVEPVVTSAEGPTSCQ